MKAGCGRSKCSTYRLKLTCYYNTVRKVNLVFIANIIPNIINHNNDLLHPYFQVFLSPSEPPIEQYCTLTHRHHLPLAGVADTQTSVLTGGAKQAAVSVPANAVDEVWVVVHRDEGLACAHVPDDYEVVTA